MATAFRSPRSIPTSIVVVLDKISIGGCSILSPKSSHKIELGHPETSTYSSVNVYASSSFF